jgi:hypothetical protein
MATLRKNSKEAGDIVINETRDWVEQVVVGLNLCPFAKAPHIKGQIRYVLSKAKTHAALLDALDEQLLYLQSTAPLVCETILLIHPHVLTDFLDYNDFLEDADSLLERLDLDGVFQIASFHPDYQFADSEADDIGNYTNRSPYPMLHILREASIDAALQGAGDPQEVADAIVARNQETLAKLGHEALKALQV